MSVTTQREMLTLLGDGRDIGWLIEHSGWHTRQIHIFAGRHGFLFTVAGVPYRPPVPTPRQRER